MAKNDHFLTNTLVLIFFAMAASGPATAQWYELGEAPQRFEASPRGDDFGSREKGLAVDASDRAAVVEFFFSVYAASEGVAAEWTGNVAGCFAGTTSLAYEDATILRVNYFRAMAGLPANVVLNPDWNARCQEAALIMIANGMLSHTPPPSWTCFTLDGSEAASNSNIAIGGDGPTAVDLYMEDDGDVNEPVGHRRWLLFPSQETMGTGSVTASNGFFFGANAIWVIGGFGGGASQPAAWPPEGFVPFQVVYDRWSYSRPNGDFSGATVTMTQDGNPVVVDVLPIQNGFGDNTLVWEPRITKGFPGGDDQSFTVRIEDVVVNFVPQTIAYTVTVIDPSVAGGGGGEGVGEGGGEGTGDGPTGPVTKVSGCGVSAGGGSDEDGDMAGGSVVVFCLVAVVLFWRGRARRRALG